MIRWNIEKNKTIYELNNIPTFLDKAIMSQAIENK